jgi:hypothetical protein
MPDYKNSSNQSGGISFNVRWWRLALRILSVIIMLALNYALLGSTLEHWRSASGLNIHTDGLSLLVLLFFNLTVLLPALLQASLIKISPEGIVVRTLLWKSKLDWAEIRRFSKPATAGFAIMWGKKCIYLLARRDFAKFDELVTIVSSHVSPPNKH